MTNSSHTPPARPDPRGSYDEKLLRATQETLERSRELLEKTRSLVSHNPAGPFIGARETDSGK
jgi:hypothetical protein